MPVSLHHSPVTNHSWDFCLLCRLFSVRCLQLRKDVSSSSAAQTEGSSAASTPADTPRLPESAVEEGEGPEGKVDREAEEEATKGASSAQETTAKQDGACGWVMLVWWANKQRESCEVFVIALSEKFLFGLTKKQHWSWRKLYWNSWSIICLLYIQIRSFLICLFITRVVLQKYTTNNK